MGFFSLSFCGRSSCPRLIPRLCHHQELQKLNRVCLDFLLAQLHQLSVMFSVQVYRKIYSVFQVCFGSRNTLFCLSLCSASTGPACVWKLELSHRALYTPGKHLNLLMYFRLWASLNMAQVVGSGLYLSILCNCSVYSTDVCLSLGGRHWGHESEQDAVPFLGLSLAQKTCVCLLFFIPCSVYFNFFNIFI